MTDKKKEQHHGKDHAETSGEERPQGCQENKTGTSEPQVAEKFRKTEPPAETVEDLKKKLDAQNDNYLRLMAEFDNYKKRTSRDFERLIESASEKLVAELIVIREDFERAVKAGDQCDNAKSIAAGMKLIFSRFDEVLSKNGLETFGGAGERFDPQFHEALMKIPDDKVPEDHIVEIFEKGYTLNKRVIKHARVVVSSGRATAVDAAEKET
jgi:molecular chaperone GrpE